MSRLHTMPSPTPSKDVIFQEIDQMPDFLLGDILSFVRSLKAQYGEISEKRSQDIDLASRGINWEQAELLRASLATFAEDWESPEMSVYDDYDSATA